MRFDAVAVSTPSIALLPGQLTLVRTILSRARWRSCEAGAQKDTLEERS